MQEDLLFRCYLSDALQCIAENTAKQVKEGKAMTSRYYDLIQASSVENRSAESIIEDITQRAGLVVIE